MTTEAIVSVKPCRPWCEEGDGHPSEHPDDRWCRTHWERMPLALSTPERTGMLWRLDSLAVYMRREYDRTPAHIVLSCEDMGSNELRLTLSEARAVRDNLDRLLQLASDAGELTA